VAVVVVSQTVSEGGGFVDLNGVRSAVAFLFLLRRGPPASPRPVPASFFRMGPRPPPACLSFPWRCAVRTTRLVGSNVLGASQRHTHGAPAGTTPLSLLPPRFLAVATVLACIASSSLLAEWQAEDFFFAFYFVFFLEFL